LLCQCRGRSISLSVFRTLPGNLWFPDAGALETFSRLKTAQSYFYIGNTLAQLDDYAGAIKAYNNALKLQPSLAQATANHAYMQTLLARDKQNEADPEEEQPEQVQVDKKKGHGTTAVIEAAPQPSEDAWMRNLNTSPAVFLQQRFEQESAAKTGGHAMKRFLFGVALLVSLLASGSATADPAPRIIARAHLEPAGPVVEGSEVKLVVDVLTTTWFYRLTRKRAASKSPV
jgi:hypothetical protein